MSTKTPRNYCTRRCRYQKLLSQAAAVVGISSINAFVLNAVIENMQKEHTLKLGAKDTMLFIDALDRPQVNPRLKQAIINYETKSQ